VLEKSVVESLSIFLTFVRKFSSVRLEDVSGVVSGSEGSSDGFSESGNWLLLSKGLNNGLVAGGILVDSINTLVDEILFNEKGGNSRVLSEVVPGLHGLEIGYSCGSDADEDGTNQN